MIHRAKTFLGDLAEFIYPSRCALCEQSAAEAFLCSMCDGALDELERRAACERCAKPLGGPGGACPYCEGKGVSPFDRVVALGAFRDPLRHLVYAVKYHGKWPLAERLADRLLAQEPVKTVMMESDCIVPVPLHRVRQIVRGFNQADVIAKQLGRRCRVRVARPLVRLRNTETQTHLHSRAKREENLKDAFGVVNPRAVEGRHIVVVDDVMTTGATLQSVAKALRSAGPASLSAIVLAVADPLGQDFQVI